MPGYTWWRCFNHFNHKELFRTHLSAIYCKAIIIIVIIFINRLYAMRMGIVQYIINIQRTYDIKQKSII